MERRKRRHCYIISWKWIQRQQSEGRGWCIQNNREVTRWFCPGILPWSSHTVTEQSHIGSVLVKKSFLQLGSLHFFLCGFFSLSLAPSQPLCASVFMWASLCLSLPFLRLSTCGRLRVCVPVFLFLLLSSQDSISPFLPCPYLRVTILLPNAHKQTRKT